MKHCDLKEMDLRGTGRQRHVTQRTPEPQQCLCVYGEGDEHTRTHKWRDQTHTHTHLPASSPDRPPPRPAAADLWEGLLQESSQSPCEACSGHHLPARRPLLSSPGALALCVSLHIAAVSLTPSSTPCPKPSQVRPGPSLYLPRLSGRYLLPATSVTDAFSQGHSVIYTRNPAGGPGDRKGQAGLATSGQQSSLDNSS